MCDNYARIICKIVVAQLAKGFGFTAINQSAADSLADVIKEYIQEIGTRSHEYSELSSRTDSNFYDIKQAFQDMGVNLHELHHFVTQADEILFAQTVPPFPLSGVEPISSTSSTPTTTTEPNTIIEYPPHIPSFLPEFPEKHTFSKTPLYGEVVTDPQQLKKSKSKQKRKIEGSLIKLTNISTTPINNYDNVKQKQLQTKSSTAATTAETTTNGTEENNNDKDKNKDQEMNELDSNNSNNSNSNSHTKEREKRKDRETSSNSSSSSNKKEKENNGDYIQPTPLKEINSSFFVKHDEDDKKHEELPRRALLSEEDTERAKKKAKCDKILSLTHESNSTIAEDDKE
ncbi:hypothetical protein CYY_001592 [Polysphondylium violaceum]|uniref:Transcription initiation factor TFIID subunit 8 n=1 Tax=Polysphondylium violaceum TaxID=133409 RepID=A0A8J4V3Z4_9MYCE|nr:hypothetical protein CYY_001592 [Polysphondylium violaceum]